MVAPKKAAELVAPNETAFDLFQLLRSSRTSVPCLDEHLPGKILSPGYTVVLHGEASSGKSVLLRSILATHLLPKTCGGHGLPSVLIDADNAFDVWLLAKVLQDRAKRCALDVADVVTEALGRLLLFRPAEPFELLKQLSGLRQIFAQNPTVIDSMSAWQSMTAAFPRSSGATLKVIAYRDGQLEFSLESEAIHLGVGCCPKVPKEPEETDGPQPDKANREGGRECFYLAPWGVTIDRHSPSTEQTFFVISSAGEVISLGADVTEASDGDGGDPIPIQGVR